ncbi:MAG: polysaccharide biosynthesis tyrosine autokinase [Chitinophagaceae bacterium]|nr:MAG: polysaccharide biosynthesis tyrosine autokinase [Chitinophagaceae bacterium]
MPAKEKKLLDVTRQQNILQELYSFLLQKKLETAIGSASTISNIKVVDPAIPGGQVSPKPSSLYIIALMIGLAIPAAIVALREILNDKVKSKADITNNTNAPVLGEIGHAEDSTTLVVTKNNRKFLAEQFRIIRSNLQYILPKVDKPVIHVTSSFSGEGKSFISTNLGAVLALSGKRTVILEFDIRKPKIMAGLGLKERTGITNYIVGNADLEDIIYQVPDIDDLYVIPCGPIPPNPAEMLLSERINDLFTSLRQRFDTVIIDTAPVGLVSDGVILGKYADASIYIVRYNYTLKKQIQLIDDIFRNKKLPHLSIIINDISAGGGYGGYYGYGGYGYGYSSDYYDSAENTSTTGKMLKKIKRKPKNK